MMSHSPTHIANTNRPRIKCQTLNKNLKIIKAIYIGTHDKKK